MKYILILTLFFCSCNNDSITITREEYNKLTKDTALQGKIQPFQYGWNVPYKVITIENHEYLYLETAGNGGIAIEHYPDCKHCKKDTL